jgi:steroid 5-alpha reductase family enzyme
VALMVVVWLISVVMRDASIVDIAWGAGFVVVAWTAFAVGDGPESAEAG